MTNIRTSVTIGSGLVGSGTMMGAYLLTRPYGDRSAVAAEAAAAYASPWWVAAHLFGVLAIALFALLTAGLDEAIRARGRRSVTGRAARALALVGAVLCLPYYGAETFGLHALGRAHQANPDAGMLAVVDQVRNHPAALATFGVGLLALSAAAVLVTLAWSRHSRSRWAAWPLGIAMALFPVQFYLPAGARMGFGVAFAICAGIWLVAALHDDIRADKAVQVSTTLAGAPGAA